jgi:cytochrome c2
MSGWRHRFLLNVFTFIFFSAAIAIQAKADVTPQHGEQIFKEYCTSCHALNSVLVGPALSHVYDRETADWITHWVENNPKFRASGDKDAVAIYNQFSKNAMPTFSNLNDDDVHSIIAYIKQQDATTGVATNNQPQQQGSPFADYVPILWVGIFILLIIIALIYRVNTNLRKIANEKLQVPEEKEFSLLDFAKRKSTWAAAGLIITFLIGYKLTQGAQNLGHEKNYMPMQPIKFSHQIHAGINQINCLYCHVGADKGKTAAIPTVNICMNCHRGVREGQSDSGTAEIQKIYAYAGFDPATNSYDKPSHPIEWVRIHNLPGYVYFNHSQHVVAGKLACQTCHGPVETYPQMYQFSSLAMGWCINCHRETGVQFTSNNYYENIYENLHQQLQSGQIDKVTEAMVGGTECQKCHY